MREERIAHLGFIQAVINRMANNSLALKGITMTLTSALLAVMGSSFSYNLLYTLSAIIPVIVFWIMDAKYLKLERQFRKLYEEVKGSEEEVLFSMNPEPYRDSVSSTLSIMFSWSVFWFYALLISATIIGSIFSSSMLQA